jgi:hypothetical protein
MVVFEWWWLGELETVVAFLIIDWMIFFST